MDQMAFDYFKESQGYETLQLPGEAFAMYRIFGLEFHIGHMFVRPELRHVGKGLELGRLLEKTAGLAGCTHLSCLVHLEPGREVVTSRLLRGYLQNGFHVILTEGNNLILKKDLV